MGKEIVIQVQEAQRVPYRTNPRKNTVNEIKNSLEGTNSRITEAEEWISDLEDKIVEITAAGQNKEKRMKRIENNFRDLWDTLNTPTFEL